MGFSAMFTFQLDWEVNIVGTVMEVVDTFGPSVVMLTYLTKTTINNFYETVSIGMVMNGGLVSWSQENIN